MNDLRAGGTDYYVQALPFTNGQVSYVSFATDTPQGFTAAHLALLDEVRPFLARRLELEAAYYATRALLDVYLGKNAARRVTAGAVKRGEGELIDAAIWFSDMRDFTALSDRTPRVIETLDLYFDAVATAIAEHGGEVLKFIGDAVMAIFLPAPTPGARAAARSRPPSRRLLRSPSSTPGARSRSRSASRCIAARSCTATSARAIASTSR